MITHTQYLSLKFGDEVEIACQDKEILDCEYYYDFPNATFEWFKVAGISSFELIAVFVPINSGIDTCWPWSSEKMESLKIDDSMFDRITTNGYWVSHHPIRAIRLASPAAKVQSNIPIPIPCLECKQFYPYAEPNYGKELVCWSCRDSLGWKYEKDVTGQVILKK